MTTLAITGHRGLPGPIERLVADALRAEVAQRADGGLVGMSCLADGPDSLFARHLLESGGELVVVVPAEHYRDGLPADHHATYDALLARAARVIRLKHTESDSEAHMTASLRMLAEADELVAVWDGNPARGYGGTADVVQAARERGVPVTVLWPEGATRD
ncbi:hypothetical protein [Saccharomonospora halophila]|uniref:hypothetical protein n=1 Tax=Saccharomonospora halophila TaxID=129922 RepID=UPI00036BCEF1|nr:hypothetical protein [Saccharomonospora halophila]